MDINGINITSVEFMIIIKFQQNKEQISNIKVLIQKSRIHFFNTNAIFLKSSLRN